MDKNKNIDQQFKTHFENRDLKPSKESWNRLDMLLDAEEKPKTKRVFPYYRVAAMVIALLVSVVIWNNFKPMTKEVIIAGNEIKDTKITPQHTDFDDASTLTLTEENPVNEDLSDVQSEVPVVKKLPNTTSRIIKTQVKFTDAVSTKSIVTPDYTVKTPVPVAEVVSPEHQLVSDVKSNKTLHIDADKLLANVEQTMIQKNKNTTQVKTNIYRPNPTELLVEVEDRTSKTFLQRLYTGIQDNTGKLYVTLSNRNIEYK